MTRNPLFPGEREEVSGIDRALGEGLLRPSASLSAPIQTMSNFTSNTSVAPDACYTGMKAWAQCGFGDCVNGTCVCHAGITGHSDLVTLDTTAWGGSTMDCFILSTLVRILWVIPIIPTSLVFVKCIRAIANQFKVYNKRDASKKWWQHPPLLISFLCIPFCPMSILFCVLKVVWPDTFLIGVDVLCTVLFAVMRVPLYTALAFAQVYNVKVAMTSKAFGNDASVVERITRKLKATQFVIWLGTMVTSAVLIVLVLVSPTVEPPQGSESLTTKDTLFIVYMITNILPLYFQAYSGAVLKKEFEALFDVLLARTSNSPGQANTRRGSSAADSPTQTPPGGEQPRRKSLVGSFVSKMSNSGSNKTSLEQTRDLMVGTQKQAIKVPIIAGTIFLVLLCVPQLWGKITYYYPITFIAYTKPMQPFFASLLAKRKQGKRIRVTPSTAVSTNTDNSTEDTA